jgi:uncharacterized repeat protein (TIGR03803 family)
MKTKLLFQGIMLVLLTAGYVQSQSQQWATTLNGGLYGQGAIVQASSNGTGFTVAHSFQYPAGFHPYGDLLLASDGNLYGTCYDGGSFASCTCYRFDPSTGAYTDVYDFDITHGDFPMSGMVEGPNGFIYGAASGGGSHGGGVIYSLDINTGTYADMYDLSIMTRSHPVGNPVFHSNGKLYGLTTIGGINNLGVLYSFDISTNTYSDLHDFNGASGPQGSLLEVNGILYGMTMTGGTNGEGAIFSFDPSTALYTKLHDFDVATGTEPMGNLILASNGLLYGMTSAGGTQNMGVIFSFNISGNTYSKLFDFNSSDGAYPHGSLSGNGNILCGSTYAGGSMGYGVMFNFDITINAYTKVHDFNAWDGSNPTGGFITVTTSGIASPGTDATISVFPNPAGDLLHVIMNSGRPVNASFTLRDLPGHVVYSSNEYMDSDKTVAIDLKGIRNGIYFLEINNGKDRIIKKVVKN